MMKLVVSILMYLFPALVLAENSSLSFAPPPGDLSVVFLGNLFGVVDGVLHGTGSQIMGAMFGVFNSAVLALGGIIIMYTLMVSTMNTAHEGQMLGQKWSSIWIPVRSTMGLALLIPKASGYCMMQIFVMWVVVQGVGAADKVWEAALGYLSRGGVIIQAQSTPSTALNAASTSGVSAGALNILAGQVCMLGLQNQLQNQRQSYLDAAQKNSGPCSGTPSPQMASFCNTYVPDFIGTVNAVTTQNNSKKATDFILPMPNFDQSSPFSFLNGICGTIRWKALPPVNKGNNNPENRIFMGQTMNQLTGQNTVNVSSSDLETAQMSRAIAIQQMYMDLSSLAQVLVNNDPQLSSNGSNSPNNTNSNFSLVAKQQYGVPFRAGRQICTAYNQTCTAWGGLTTQSGVNAGVLLNGTEFLGAITDYNAIMMPTLNLMKQAQDAANANSSRQFIDNAITQGWVLAGSYFFDLVRLNGNAVSNSDLFDSNTGLDQSEFNATNIISPFGTGGTCVGQWAMLCTWFNKDSTMLSQVQALIDGSALTTSKGRPVTTNPIPKPDMSANASSRAAIGSLASSTVYGLINNSVMIQLPGQPGLSQMKFGTAIHFSVDPTNYTLPSQTFSCGYVKIVFFKFCLGGLLGDIFYNYFFRFIYNFFLTLFGQIINQVIMAFIQIPLQGFGSIFNDGLKILSQPGVNPIIALANMGTTYINFSANLWMMMLNITIVSALIPVFGIFIFAVISLAMPLLLAWIGVMMAIGFTTAYYIPILPYMIFTFGTLAWLIAVIEAMVAAPIVALGVTHPEGHDAFGKGEAAIMILMNVFLRPSMMIIGYISGIALSYVGVWLLNAGFQHAVGFIQSTGSNGWTNSDVGISGEDANLSNSVADSGSGSGGYTGWAGIYAYFFSILLYTTTYLTIVQKAFTLITYLPDKVLRWIGGAPEQAGEQAAQWGEEGKQKMGEAAQKTGDAQGQIGQKLGGYGQKAVGSVKGALGKATSGGGGISGAGGGPPSTPSNPE